MNEEQKIEIINQDPNLPQTPVELPVPESTPPEKGSKLKTLGVIFIFALLFAVVLFLPEISNYMKEKMEKPIPSPIPEEETYQKRICTLQKETEDIMISVKLTFLYQDNNLKKETLFNTTTLSSITDDDKILYHKQLKCQAFKEVIEQQDGIKQTCTLKDNAYTINQEIDYAKLEDIVVDQNIGELEGFYPEFTYNQDKNYIETQLAESGYVCNSGY